MGAPGLEVADIFRAHGPAWRQAQHAHLIARQLCEANQSQLAYEAVPAGGSCFRILMPRSQALWDGKPTGPGGTERIAT